MNELPAVAGRLEISLAQHEQRCLVLLAEEQERANPNNALIAALCDSVRVCREYVDYAQRPSVSQQSQQWRELAHRERQALNQWKPTAEAIVELTWTLIAAADACDQLTYARDFHFKAANRYCEDNTKLRELLATARQVIPVTSGLRPLLAAIDAALTDKDRK